MRYALLLALVVWVWPGLARAELYTWTDENGVIHFTNVRPGSESAVSGKQNTYEWRDELGGLRRLHKVDVATYDELIREAARYYTLPPALVKAVVAAESGFEPSAVSHAGAQGLMQLIPSTAREMKVRDPFDPEQNVYGGARYLRVLANQFEGDIRLTLAGYNAGPQAVKRAGRRVPAIEETQIYVRRVLQLYEHYLESWDAGRK